jgi:hypothetical protein
MTDGNEGLLGRYGERRSFALEETAVTVEEAQLLAKIGNPKLQSQARALLRRNGHKSL